MSLAATAAPTAGAPARAAGGSRAVALWLLLCAALVYAMILLGGITRLSGSGLSIVEWKPLAGTLPPLGEAAWQRELAAYRTSPEFRLENRDITLEGFRRIFWIEWGHRLLGRLIGVAFAVPLAVFALRRRIPRRLLPALVGIFLLGGAQGALGWYMVKSGLVDVPQVSAYRLTAHLLLGSALLAALLWAALGLLEERTPAPRSLVWLGRACTLVAVTTVTWGGFMAGTHAGYAYRTFPLLAGRLVPDGLWDLHPWWRSAFEAMLTVQFLHRSLALLTLLLVFAWWWQARRLHACGALPLRMRLLPILAALQVGLGVATLLLGVPAVVASLHQAGGMAVLAGCLVALHGTAS